MNVSVEVESGLKQLKNGGEVVIDKLKVKRVSIADSLKSKFVYNVGGYHHTPIPSQLDSKLKNAHPSPLLRFLSVCKRLLSDVNLCLIMAKVSVCMKCMYVCVFSRLPVQSLCVCNNVNNSQSGLIANNDISSNSSNNEDNLQSINIDNRLYNNRLTNYTYNNMILSNMTKIQ